MQFTEIFIRKPILSIVFSLFILLVGVKAFLSLPIRLYPSISPSVINVQTAYPGAPAQLMESFVTTPLENALGGIEGVDVTQSSSTLSVSQITLRFKLDYDLTKAMTDVSNAIASVRKQLPAAVLDPVINTKDPNADPTLFISFTSHTLSLPAITDYLTRVIQPELQIIPGVSQAQIFGNNNYAFRIWLDPIKMMAHQITASDITTALQHNNIQSASGSLITPNQIININTNTDIHTTAELNNLVIRKQGNYLVRLSDIGQAVLGIESNNENSANVNGNTHSVIMGIVPLNTANPLDVSKAVIAQLPELEKAAPADIKIHLIWNSSKFIAASLHDVKKTIFEACLLVFTVIFLFLASFRAGLIPLATIPLSLMGVCIAMLALGYSLNVLTFLAWVLGIGLVVDDAIVVLENIHRHISLGKTPENAAIIGTQEIGLAIVAMTLTLAAVYAPIGFIHDMTGLLFREFAFTLSAAVIISGFIALTLSPMMCAKLLKHEHQTSRFGLKVDHFFNITIIAYKKYLLLAINHRKAILSLGIVVYLICFGLFKSLPSELAPQENQGFIISANTGPTSANLAYMEKYMAKIQAIYKTIPAIDTVINIIGIPTTNNALSFLILKPWNKCTTTSAAIIQTLFKRFWGITGLQGFAFNPHVLPGATGHAPLIFVLKSTDSYNSLYQFSKKLQIAITQNNPRIIGLQSDLKMDADQIQLNIDRDKANFLGISMSDIGNSLNTLVGAPQASLINWKGRSYKIIPELYRNDMSAEEQLKLINVRGQNNQLIPLANFVHIENTSTALSLNHFQQLRAVTLSANLAPGYTIGAAVNYLSGLATKILPHNVQIDFAGETRQFIQAGNSLQQTFLLALLFIFLILSAQFESFRAAFIILISVPLSLTGALLTLYITKGTLNIYTQIGLITLIGLITKHGILIVEFARQLKNNPRLSIQEAVIEAASLRLRPIFMTTATMLLAAIPLALADGPGAHARNQLGWVILGGISIGTFFTLFILPVVYTLIYRHKKTIDTAL
jgi:hydrophobe/amphiphile efflux-1 (HAE1) family protein